MAAIARNLLGRLNARSTDDLQRIAAFWRVPVPVGDRARQVGALYRTMTDIRHARSLWERLGPGERAILRDLSTGEAIALPIEEIATHTGLDPDTAQSAAVALFHGGLLSREGDNQELPVGVLPRLFLPREVGQVFRRLQDELDAGDLSGSALRVVLEMLDDAELEEAAGIWGLTVIPGQRRRNELVNQIMRQIASPERVDQIVHNRTRDARAIWDIVRDEAPTSLPLNDVLWRAGLASSAPEPTRTWTRIEQALGELESALLVFHTWRRDGSRWLFVPQEIARPGDVARTMPMRTLQPLPADKTPIERGMHRWALAWDLLTILREIVDHGAPVWVPGEPLARTWQRRVNRRLWGAGDEIPARGYLGFLFSLGIDVGVLQASDEPLPPGTDKGAIRVVVSPSVREWTRLSFAEQTRRLRDAWLASDSWIEGRERGEMDVWGADWRKFRQTLCDLVGALDASEWLLVDDVSARFAEQQPGMIGASFAAATSRAPRPDVDERTAALAQLIEIELETALAWLGIVVIGTAPRSGLALRLANPPEEETSREPALQVSESGLVVLDKPAPLHVWSLSAFADAESLQPEATYQLRPGSVSRALAAGFGLEQIQTYLSAQSGNQVPEALQKLLRDWTVGYRRVWMRRAVTLAPDTPEATAALRDVLRQAGLTVLDGDTASGLVVILPPDDTTGSAEAVQAALRASGYAGQWDRRPGRTEDTGQRT